MLTIFAAPKPFRGHIGIIQRNAIRSWTLLRPACEVILLGNEEGIAEAAEKFGCRHIPDVVRNSLGTPLVSDLFKRAQESSANDVFCYVNSDIVLMSDFNPAVRRVVERKRRFLLVGHRWNLDVTEELTFGSDWEEQLRGHVSRRGTLAFAYSIDYFVFPRGLYDGIPPFAIGRPRWDNWMLYRARSLRVPLIDASPVVMAVHQNHDYSHHAQGREGVRVGAEASVNEDLAGGLQHLFNIADATHLLTPQKLRVTFDRHHVFRHCETLPILYPWPPLTWAAKAVSLSRPLRHRFGLTLNSVLGRSEN